MMTVRPPQRFGPQRNAFGVLELAIVMGLVAVLFILAAPGVRSVIVTSRSAKCMAQLKQIYVGMILYTQDYNGHLPPATNPREGETTWTVPWRGVWCVPSSFPEKGFPRYFAGGISEVRTLMICPENLSKTPNYQIPANFRNYYLCNYELMTSSGYPEPPARLANIELSNTVLLFDAAATTAGAYTGLPAHAYQAAAWSRIGENHRERVNVLWADGHVTAVFKDDLTRKDFERKPLQ